MWIQGTPPYRFIAHKCMPDVIVRESEGKEPGYVTEKSIKEAEKKKYSTPFFVTNYIVQFNDRSIGSGQLVHRSEESGCFKGFWIHGIYIKPLYRRMGLGKALIRAMVSNARERKAEEIFIQVFESNHSAVRMYERAGFQYLSEYCPELKEYLDTIYRETGKRAVIMHLLL